jgi:MSHA biogenesis protein MshJ|tara:strand:+ start:403 stop:1056 length:654 start_codon:yes stop_codon:yes gene_type:complete
MKHRWVTGRKLVLVRLNALRLRERVLLFLSVIIICALLVEVLWVSPAQAAHNTLQQRFDKQSNELQRTRAELASLAVSVDPQKILRDELAAVKISLAAVNRTISGVSSVVDEAPLPLAQVLVQLLRQHEGLKLLRTSTGTPKMTADETTQTGAELSRGLTQQNVELTVSGPYFELTQYVQTLEEALPHVRWGSMKLISEKPPTELTLQLFVVGEYAK